jgi:GNAT superfamily N-acetyltransferase
MPGAVEDAVILLERIEQEARLAGAARLCGPCWRAGSFYGGYLLGSEPYHPHWAIDGTAAYVQAGWRISHPAVLLRMSLYTTLDQRPLPDTYRIEEVDAPAEFDARTMRVLATLGGEEAATCTARIFPNLRGAHGGTVGQIGYVGTAESHRGKGLAKALVSHSLRRLHDWGASEALIATGLDNEPALRAYEAVGFQRFANLNEWSKALSG